MYLGCFHVLAIVNSAAVNIGMHVTFGFCEIVGSEVSMGHIYPQGMLAATTLVGGRTGGGGVEPEPDVSWGFSCAQWQSPPYQGQGQGPRFGAEALRELGFFPCVMAVSALVGVLERA